MLLSALDIRVELEFLLPIKSMRKLNFLLGAIGGMLGGLLLSNKKLRRDLRDVNDPKEAAKLVGKELQRSGKQIAEEAKEWMEREDVQRNMRKAKRYFWHKLADVKNEAEHVAGDAAEIAKEKATIAYGKARGVVEKKLGR